jgi:site-specific DNA-methyltransferase (adenine-specific)
MKDLNIQYNLFGEIETEVLTTNKAAMRVGVSVATIHNWIKTGYLQTTSHGFVRQDSVETFLQNVSGTEKLRSRANKLQKDEHNHKLLSDKIERQIHSDRFSDNLWMEYESSLSESFRNKEGIYYTPEAIISDMMQSVDSLQSETFLDPCCGCGKFIVHALEKGFAPENIYGVDTDPNAVEITKKRIFEKTGFRGENIVCRDFLEFARTTQGKFTYIFTNPPWGKKLPKETKDVYASIYKAGKSTDTSSLFVFACLNILKENGMLGFLLPEAFFNISSFEDVRKVALRLHIDRLVDYGKPFKGLLTRAQAIVLKNEPAHEHSTVTCEFENQHIQRTQHSFCSTPKHIFNFWATQDTHTIIEHIYSLPHITLADHAQWGLGIVTGNNAKTCRTVCEKGFVPVFRGQDITADGLKTPALFISEDLSKCQQVAPPELYKAEEKLIYRFISNSLVFYCDTQQHYILNSANMLVLKDHFPLSGQQLADLLNSSFMNWVFANLFRTHKILRGDLELLPIHTGYFLKNKGFDEKRYLTSLGLEKDTHGTYRITR